MMAFLAVSAPSACSGTASMARECDLAIEAVPEQADGAETARKAIISVRDALLGEQMRRPGGRLVEWNQGAAVVPPQSFDRGAQRAGLSHALADRRRRAYSRRHQTEPNSGAKEGR
jgi:hypothetical protein